jgi:transcriptional regulator with XRE-family HTH domain
METPSVLLWHIGDVVRKVREARGLSRKELADLADIRQNTLGELERNVSNYERETLNKVAIALQITVEALHAAVPNPQLPSTLSPDDAETIARFLKLEREQRHTVRIVVDQLGRFPDRQRPPGAEQSDAPHTEPTSRSSP